MVSLLVVPPMLAFELCPGLMEVYSALPVRALAVPFVFGALWGFAQLGAGVGVHRLGFAISGAILGGVGTAVGTLVPLIMQHSSMVFQTSGLLIFAGTGITLVAVSLCGWAGYHRTIDPRPGRGAGFGSHETAMTQAEPTSRGYLWMLIAVVLSGALSAFTNIALGYWGESWQKSGRRGRPRSGLRSPSGRWSCRAQRLPTLAMRSFS